MQAESISWLFDRGGSSIRGTSPCQSQSELSDVKYSEQGSETLGRQGSRSVSRKSSRAGDMKLCRGGAAEEKHRSSLQGGGRMVKWRTIAGK